jgi:RND family efflux transporter MFP subunit
MTGLCRTLSLRIAPLTLMGLLGACSPKADVSPVVPSVFVTEVRNDTGVMTRVLFGQIRPRVESELSFRAGGKITERGVELGQAVRAGQALARIDPADYQLAVGAAEEQQRIAEVDAVQAASEAVRFKRLMADGSVGAADAERQQARADAAAARLTQAQKQTELARNREAYTVLTAPFDGVVTAVRFELGQLVDDKLPVLSLARPGELEVLVDVPEALVPSLKSWQASVLVGDAAMIADAKPLPLKLRELAPSANLTTRTTRARYALAEPLDGKAWRISMSAEVRLQRKSLQAGAELPVGALLVTVSNSGASASTSESELAAGPTVWLVDAKTGVLKRQSVQLLAQTTEHVRVAGLPDGVLAVSVGAHKLDAGMKVQPVQRPLAAVQPALIPVVTPAMTTR